MTIAEAKELLLMHSFAYSDVDHPKMKSGFLGSLRPFSGHLNEQNYHEVMAALLVLAPSLEQPVVDREVVRSLWGICHLARAWGVYPDGMLRSNGLIQPADVERLDGWIEHISYATMVLLDGGGIDVAFEFYDNPTAA
ncbi:hypothetical protein [Pedosphaera parvula]|uniref:Uncharacterized protein n=1 Tax=Pedosphaera parvula (strain Ellin514) TaxID=320771 RepID=B9XHQ6_PEDPL|nr:hypothetical protein [Pedosphaera parvula]EEF60634.1 hypothetical protein Cflav_PD6225 [Pedosphaera parvula Ellin514]